MNKAVKTYLWLEKFLPGVLFISIFVIMLLEIAYRALTNKSIAWNTEFCRYALAWVTFLGAVYVRRERSHIQVVFLHEWLARKGHRIALFMVNLIRSLTAIAFWAFLAYFGHQLSNRTVRFYSSAMSISQYWLYICAAVCGVLTLIMESINLLRLLFGGGDASMPAATEPLS